MNSIITKNVHFFVVMLFFLLLPSCIKQQSSSQNEIEQPQEVIDTTIDTKNELLDTIMQQEAMLVDIPIPLYDERIIPSDYISHSDTLIFGYKSPLSRAHAREFFMTQMERYGWKHLVSFTTAPSETLLQFESPDRYCSVVIKNTDAPLEHSLIFIYIKKSEHTGSPISSGLG